MLSIYVYKGMKNNKFHPLNNLSIIHSINLFKNSETSDPQTSKPQSFTNDQYTKCLTMNTASYRLQIKFYQENPNMFIYNTKLTM